MTGAGPRDDRHAEDRDGSAGDDVVAAGPDRADAEREDREVERTIFFSDAVIAIAITLLVLKIDVPELSDAEADRRLGVAVVDLIPGIVTFVWSFLVVARFWTIHRRLFSGLRRIDARLSWLNVAFLVLIALLPFPADILGRFGPSLLSISLFAGCIVLIGLMLSEMRRYAEGHPDLMRPGLTADHENGDAPDRLFTPAVFLLSVPVAAVAPTAAPFVWLLLIARGPVVGLLRRLLAGRTVGG